MKSHSDSFAATRRWPISPPKGTLEPMSSLCSRYTHWLHTRWPAGTVERLPECDEQGRTNIPGVRIVGDLTGFPLLKFSADTGARAVREIVMELEG